MTVGFRFLRKKPENAKRDATPGKARRGGLIGSLVALSIAFAFLNIARQTMSNIQDRMGSALITAPADAETAPAAAQPSPKNTAAKAIGAPLSPTPGFILAPNVLKAVILVKRNHQETHTIRYAHNA